MKPKINFNLSKPPVLDGEGNLDEEYAALVQHELECRAQHDVRKYIPWNENDMLHVALYVHPNDAQPRTTLHIDDRYREQLLEPAITALGAIALWREHQQALQAA